MPTPQGQKSAYTLVNPGGAVKLAAQFRPGVETTFTVRLPHMACAASEEPLECLEVEGAMAGVDGA
jgi:hypothetical protein